jgi:acetyl/propionyl-CoA carboxylase alpha subunit
VDFEFLIGGRKHRVRTDGRKPEAHVTVDERSYDVDWQRAEGGVISLLVDGRSHTARVARRDGGLAVWIDGRSFVLETGAGDDESFAGSGSAVGGSGRIKAPMPGAVVKLAVSEGEQVTTGQSLVIVEAMKMEHDVRSPIDGVVAKVNVAAGDSVGTTEAMIEIEPNESDG